MRSEAAWRPTYRLGKRNSQLDRIAHYNHHSTSPLRDGEILTDSCRHSDSLMATANPLYMADAATISQLQVLQRQYFQLVEPHQLKWLDDATLKASHTQLWIYTNMFDANQIKSPPPDRYQLRVLKLLISKLERAIDDPEEDVRHLFLRRGLIAQFHSLYATASLHNQPGYDIVKYCHAAGIR